MLLGDLGFEEVWLADFEFQASPGNRPMSGKLTKQIVSGAG